MNVLWFLPTHGDGRYLASAVGGRAVDLGYLRQIAQAADRLGYSGVLIPTGRSCEDPWVVAASLIAATERLRFQRRLTQAPASLEDALSEVDRPILVADQPRVVR